MTTELDRIVKRMFHGPQAASELEPSTEPLTELDAATLTGQTNHAVADLGRSPFVQVSLADNGLLQLELPGANGTRRAIALALGHEAEIIQRVLAAKRASRVAIGEDGAPTTSQVRHWQMHYMFGDSRCPHCIAEGRARVTSPRASSPSRGVGDGSVTVRRLAPRRAKATVAHVGRTAEELGL